MWSCNHALLTLLPLASVFLATLVPAEVPGLVFAFMPPIVLSSKRPKVTDNQDMAQIQLTPAQRKDQRAEAHHLNAVVMIGSDGLTAAVKKETDAALNAHGLIKVRVQSDDRAGREAIFQILANELNAAPIQHIGKLLVLWRPLPEKEKKISEDRMPGPRDVKVLKNSSRYGQRPEVKVLRVLGNQRLTPGGTVKRAKKPQLRSAKKRSQD
jgi:putative YhbY family RNA-binding protein